MLEKSFDPDPKKAKLELKEWQKIHLRDDPSFGNLIASVLQSLYKNKYSSFLSLLNTIEKNSSVVLSREGTIDLLLRLKNIIRIIPKFYIAFSSFDLNRSYSSEMSYSSNILSIKCDFIIFLNYETISGLSNDYISALNKAIDTVEKNNRNILSKYLLKQMSRGHYFASLEFLDKEIFYSKIPLCKYTINDIFRKFEISKNSTFEMLLTSANLDNTNEKNINAIKVLNIPFTQFHANNYLSNTYQHICRDRFGIGKEELHTKLIFLNTEHIPDETNRTVYDILVDHIYSNYFIHENEQKTDDKRISNFKIETENDIDVIYNLYTKKDIFSHQKVLSDENIDTSGGTEVEKIDRKNRQKMIFGILKNDCLSQRELAFLKSLDKDKLLVKQTFVDTISHLTNPFLSKLIDINSIRLLKQYIITNYGKNLKENIPKEVRNLIEKKLLSFIQSEGCFFIEFQNFIVRTIAEFTDETESLVESVITSSSTFRNFSFIKHFKRPKKFNVKSFSRIINLVGNDYYNFNSKGHDNDMVLIPFIKIKEFLVYLTSSEISQSWEKLSELFNLLLPSVCKKAHTAFISDTEISMSSLSRGSHSIYVKDNDKSLDFHIKDKEEIEFVFQDKEHEEIKSIIEELYRLHDKTAYGFINNRDFNKLLDQYHKRCNEYYLYRDRVERYEKKSSSTNFFIAILKKILYWIPRSLNKYHLNRSMNESKEIEKNVTYSYTEKSPDKKSAKAKKEMEEIKEKISEYAELAKQNEKECFDKNAYKTKKPKEKPPAPLIELEEQEERVFDFAKKYIQRGKDVVIIHDTDKTDEKIIVYVKENDEKKEPSPYKNINTLDELSTRYSVIKSLIKKQYLMQKSAHTIVKGKKTIVLSLAKAYIYYHPTDY